MQATNAYRSALILFFVFGCGLDTGNAPAGQPFNLSDAASVKLWSTGADGTVEEYRLDDEASVKLFIESVNSATFGAFRLPKEAAAIEGGFSARGSVQVEFRSADNMTLCTLSAKIYVDPIAIDYGQIESWGFGPDTWYGGQYVPAANGRTVNTEVEMAFRELASKRLRTSSDRAIANGSG